MSNEDVINYIARKFHETYEVLAPSYSYKTRVESAVPWEFVPTNNKNLMIAVVSSLIDDNVIEPGEDSCT